MKLFLILFASTVGLITIGEFTLRLTQGLGNPPLYLADEDLGYLLAPNQKLHRSGNLIEVNQYSMRHGSIKPAKESNTERIFLLGDSVVNGSWWTDQSEILSSLVAKKLEANNSKTVEVFNASTNSWGPQNELAYLKRYGLFNADTLILVINTDDLWATKPTSVVVGSYNYPDKKPPLALVELYQFYLATPRQIPELEKLRSLKQENLAANLAAIKEIKTIAEKSNTKFILALTPLLREFKADLTEDELKARTSLQQLVTAEGITYLDFRELWSDFPQPEFLYRDRIHPSPQGNTKIVEQLISIINN